MLLCVPVKAKTQSEVEKKLKKISFQAEVAEIWLDQIQDFDLEKLCKNPPLKLLLTYKRPEAGGQFEGSWQDMAQALMAVCQFSPEYIDIPFNMPENLNKKIVQEVQKFSVQTIISHHDFKKTPSLSSLKKLAQDMQKRGGDILKIATHCRDTEEVVRLMDLAHWLIQKRIRHIVIGMGPVGQLTRLKSPQLGNEMMFAVLDQKEAEHGQLTVKRLRQVWKLLGNQN